MADSRHNKYVSVTDWFKPAPGSTTSGTASGSTGAATSGASFVGGSWGSGGSGGGLTITIIKTNDTTPESNSNVYSALRVHNSFIAKDKDERTEGKLSSDVGFEVGEFVSGASGAICYIDPETLQTTAELDRLKVRIKAYFETLEIINVNSVGGKQIISPAGSINCIRVDEYGGTIDILKERQATDEEGNPLYDINGNPIMETYIESVDNGVPEDTYRCYFLAELDGETIENRFHVGDQAYSQMFDAQPGISSNVSSKYYWRLVTGISYDPIEIAGKKYHYIDLSVSDCDTDSDAPSVGDIICHRGHRTLPGDIEGRDRQNALEFSAVDTFSPSITLYQGIGESDPDNGKYPYSLVGKDIIQYGVNRLNNRAFMNVYGDMYVGDRDGQSYLQFDETAGLTVKGNIQFGSKSKMDGDDLTLEERIELASKAYEEDVNQFKAAVEKSFLDVLNQIDGAIETYFLDPEPTLENKPAVDWNTDSIKASHVGDLYYSKQGNAYRFQYDEITNEDGSKYNRYYWNLINDTNVTLALANAQKAQDTADSKRKIFVRQPSTNDSYDEGDMWANATYPATGVPKYSNDLLRAVTSKQEGEPFSIDHWVLSSKYTDDTAAIAAQEAADEAQRAANNAQSDATAAANRLSSWAADNVISPTEKQGIKEEYVRVIKDKDSIHEQWDQYFLDTTDSTEIGKIYIAYNNAYLPYVEQLIYLFTAKDSDGVALENIPIPDDFDDNQTAYYSNRAIALNTIAAAAKKVADDAQAAANNAYEEAEKALTAAEEAKTSVYGLNTTVTGLKDFTDDAFLDGIINSSERKTIENYIYQINTVLAQVQQSYSEVVDNTFLVESVAKTNLENSYNSFITATNELLQTVNVISSQGSVENIDRAGFEVKYNNFNSKYSDYTKYLNAAIKFIEYAINSRVDTTLQELGGYSYLKNAFNEETTVTGGLVLTSLVALGYTDDNQQYHVMGGINGSHANNDGIAIWAGGSAIDRAIEPNNPNAADFLVRMDGTGYAAGGNFWWESDGTIHADPLSFVISENSVGALLSSLKVYYNVTDNKPSPYALEPLVPFTKLTIASDIELNSNARIALGDVYIAYDPENKAIYFADSKGGVVNFYITGGMSMFGQGNISVNSIMDAISLNLDPNTLTIQNGVLTVIGGTGSEGINEEQLENYLTINNYAKKSDIPSLSGYQPLITSSNKLAYSLISGTPTLLSSFTNDSGFITSSALNDYLPLSGGTLTNHLSLGTSDTTANLEYRVHRSGVRGSVGISTDQTYLLNKHTDGIVRLIMVGYNGLRFRDGSNEYTVYHSGNFTPSDYLPKTGGTIKRDNVTLLLLNNTGETSTIESGVRYEIQGSAKAWIGYNSSYGAILYNYTKKSHLGIKDDGSLSYSGGTIFHSGNFNPNDYLPINANAVSASKLKTPRTIWGQSFDGTGNVSGHAMGLGGYIDFQFSDEINRYGGTLYLQHRGDGSSTGTGDGATGNLVMCRNGGYVGIGIPKPAYNLDVNGTFNVSSNTSIGGTISVIGKSTFNNDVDISQNLAVSGTTTSKNLYLKDYMFMNDKGEGIYLTNNALSWHNSSNAYSVGLLSFDGAGLVKVNKLSVSGNASVQSLSVNGGSLTYDSDNRHWKLNGNLLVTGGIAMYSDGSDIGGGGTGGGGSIDYPLKWSGFSSGSYDGSSTQTIYIPSKLSELTNDASYAKTADLSGYLPLSGGALTASTTAAALWVQSGLTNDSAIGFKRKGQSGWAYITYRGGENWCVSDEGWTKNLTLYHSGNFNPSDYLPKSGGVVSGKLTITNNGNEKLILDTTESANYNLIAFQQNGTSIGYIGTINNVFRIKFENYPFYYNGNDVLHSGNYNEYALPLTGGTLAVDNGVTLKIHRKQDNTVPYIRFGQNDSNEFGEFGVDINGNLVFWALKSNNLQYNKWNIVLTSGNYSSYALPLTGGTLTQTENKTSLLFKNTNYDPYISFQKGSAVLGHIVVNSSGVLQYHPQSETTYHTVIHSGNIGSQSVASAEVISKVYANENINNYSRTEKKLRLISCTLSNASDAVDKGYPNVSYLSGISVLTNYTGWQMLSYGAPAEKPNPYYRAVSDKGVWTGWNQLAFLTDNVASATKLETRRTIWGQGFDGSGNVSGNMTEVSSITMSGDIIMNNNMGVAIKNTNGTHKWVLLVSTDNRTLIGSTELDSYFRGKNVNITYGSSQTSGIYLNSSGSVGISTTSPNYKLDVNGDLGVSSSIKLYTGDQINGVAGIAFNYNSGGSVETSIYDGNKTEIARFKSGGVSINKSTTLSSGLTVSGTVNMSNVCGTNGLDICPFGSSVAGSRVFFTTNTIRPWGDDKDLISLGTSSFRWKNVYSNFNDTIAMKTNTIRFECDANGSASGRGGEINRYNGNLHLQYNTTGATTICVGGGNVGIGIASPLHKLHVNGVIYTGSQVVSPYFMAGLDVEGLYMATSGISWHDDKYAYKASLISFTSNSISLQKDTSCSGTLSVEGASTFKAVNATNVQINYGQAYNIKTVDGGNIRAIYIDTAGLHFGTSDASTVDTRITGKSIMLRYGADGATGFTLASDGNVAIANKITAVAARFGGTNGINIGMTYNDSTTSAYDLIERRLKDSTLYLQYNHAGGVNMCNGGGTTTLGGGLSVKSTSTFTGKTTHNGGIGATSGTFSGNVGIGTESPSTKLQVNGVIFGYAYSAIGNNNAAFVFDKNGSHATGIGSCNTADTIYFGACNTSGAWVTYTQTWKFGGNIITNGGITMYSDQRKKTILNHVELSLKDIANAPLIEHYYNSDNKKTTHVGSIAQYWASMNDWFCKLDSEGYYTMEIQNCALASAISIARELDRYESETDRRIANLERENALLKEEIRNLKSA